MHTLDLCEIIKDTLYEEGSFLLSKAVVLLTGAYITPMRYSEQELIKLYEEVNSGARNYQEGARFQREIEKQKKQMPLSDRIVTICRRRELNIAQRRLSAAIRMAEFQTLCYVLREKEFSNEEIREYSKRNDLGRDLTYHLFDSKFKDLRQAREEAYFELRNIGLI